MSISVPPPVRIPGEFHIHIDAAEIDAAIESVLMTKHQFRRKNFTHRPGQIDCYAPQRHLTLKVFDSVKFDSTFSDVLEIVDTAKGMRGYIEGELVASAETVVGTSYNGGADLPFSLSTRRLSPGTFRESEVHVTFHRRPPDAQLVTTLRRMGLFPAEMVKSDGPSFLFTTQGTLKQIAAVLPLITAYLKLVGGFEKAKIKEERIVRWWMSNPDVELPPVIDILRCQPEPL